MDNYDRQVLKNRYKVKKQSRLQLSLEFIKGNVELHRVEKRLLTPF